ncbi:hypothetical protein PV327_001152 [Microctonus hyperodae]|uniref:Tektin n=1 Tax=Microctonus hyperodae TaxID=165561 RepID=A0AA39G8L9_MICHY|nr:hypothetical protein PV327_001152 [Microctonus hyperodae]
MNSKCVMYSQLQPWSNIGISPCMEQVSGAPVPARVGEMYRTPRPHPWRPTLGYETVQVKPLPSQTLTNELCDPCYTPSGMATHPLKFPNLVTGFHRNPGHAARTALYTRYTPCEWHDNQIHLQNEVDATRHYSDELRDRSVRLIRETEEKIKIGQINSSRLLREKIMDTTYWERELAAELDKIIVENAKMQECMRNLQSAIQEVETPLHITQECLYHREARIGNELIHDEAEQALLQEVEIVRNGQKKLESFTDKCTEQLSDGRAVQNEIELDINSKNSSLGIDAVCHQINNQTRGLQYYGGIEKYDPTIIEDDSGIGASNDIIKKSQMLRINSRYLQDEIAQVINGVFQEIWRAWNNTNNALTKRIAEILPVKNKLLILLDSIQREIFNIKRNEELLKKTVSDKSSALKVAHTRLEARTHRPQTELCCDSAQHRMVHEVHTIKGMIDDFHERLQECEAQHQQLLLVRNNLESDLKAKVDALFIDREKVMGLRRSYPIKTTIKF